jgi:serine/threonine-protein kinase HipA
MQNKSESVLVTLWGHEVGFLASGDRGIRFQYSPAFIATAYEISPLMLKKQSSDKLYSFDLKATCFQGLPGVFSDSLPDSFGNAVIEHYFAAHRGVEKGSLSPLQKLLFIGDRAMGALEYEPREIDEPSTADALNIANLVQDARSVIRGDLHVSTPEIMKIGASAAGARPKAIVGWNEKTNEVISGLASLPEGFGSWLIKFDGVDSIPSAHCQLEYSYALMAKECGIEMARCVQIEENGRSHFMTERFDRSNNKKIHMHSLCGVLHADFTNSFSCSYEDFLRTTLAVTNNYKDVTAGFERMVFNVAAKNKDDHSKNFSYLMKPDGKWRLSPAYDLTHCSNSTQLSDHQMRINNKGKFINKKDLMTIAEKFSIKEGEKIIDNIVHVVSHWKEFGLAASVTGNTLDSIGESLKIGIDSL